ncbi:protodermal factor 1-like [Forsythia ovata]|uniref:Protodermal factor 1-like n=1 Tax=Forsythia ovata TaxID=205694 RepID=A0ABD1S8E6_9LAMI
MERKRSKHASMLLWATVAALLTQNLVIPVMSSATFEDQKTYYSPDPHTGSHASPPHGSGGGHGSTPTPSHRTPSHGGGSYGGTPPAANCGNPPSGGHHHTTPSPPTGGGGGYYHSPPSSTPTTPTTPTPITVSPPTTPIDPGTPTTPIYPGTPPTGGGGGYYHSPPSSTPTTPTTPTPIIVSPPTTPIDPGTPTTPIYPGTPTTPIDPGTPTIPGISIPSPPFAFDPNSPPFSCDYWRTHPGLIFGLFGWWGTVGGALGVASLPGLGSNTNLIQALSNTRSDGLGALYREGTAALLNSMVHRNFRYTTRQVRDSFAAALSSNKAAATQAKLFKQANEGRTKPGA